MDRTRLPPVSSLLQRLLVPPLAVAAGGVVVATAAGFLGAFSPWLDLLSHFRLQLIGVGALLVLLALMAGARRCALAALAAAIVNTAAVGSWMPPLMGAIAAPTQGGTLTLASLNLHFSNPEPESVIRFLRQEQPDVVVLQEVDAYWAAMLGQLSDIYPHRRGCAAIRFCDVAVLSRRPWSSAHIGFDENMRLAVAVVRFSQPGGAKAPRGGGDYTVVSTHLAVPFPEAQADLQRRQAAMVAMLVRALDTPVVLAGDLNTTPWSRLATEFRAASGLVAEGSALPTWPVWLPPVMALPIDHVMVGGGATVLERRLGPPVGSDHRPVLARIALPVVEPTPVKHLVGAGR